MGRHHDDDDDRATRPYQPVRRNADQTPAPRRRKKIQVRAADDAAIAPTPAPRRPRIRTRTGRRPPTAPIERPADLQHIARLLRRSPLELIYEQREAGLAWVLDDKQRLHVYDGEKIVDDFWATPTAKAREERLDGLLAAGGAHPAELRRTLWRTDRDLFVELELLGERSAHGAAGDGPWHLLITCGMREGASHTQCRVCDSVSEARKVVRVLARVYQDFIEVEDKVPLMRKQRREQGGHAQLPLVRCYRRPVRGGTREAFVALSGCRLYCDTELQTYADRVDGHGVIELRTQDQAEAALEKWIADHRRERYFLQTLTYDASRFVG